LNSQPDPGSVPSSPARGIAGQVVANTSLLIAVLVYMGWAYDDALYGYFHVRPLDLNVSIVEYMLRSLALFSTALIFVAVAIIAVTTIHAWGLNTTKLNSLAAAVMSRVSAVPGLRHLASPDTNGQSRAGRVLLTSVGATIMVTALALYWIANYVQVSTYLFLLLLGGGLLLFTWPSRADRHGRFPYAMAIVVAAVCALWAASIYAHNLGIQAAKNIVHDLPTRTAVVVYSIHPLALTGPGVKLDRLPAKYRYHYRYQGLRMLITRAGTYYLLPVDWSPQLNETYVFNESDQIRIELISVKVAS